MKRAPAIHVDRSDFAQTTGRGSLAIPRWHPFAPRWDSYGRAVFLTQAERDEFIARWNDSEWVERFGPITHGDSNTRD